MLCCSYRPGDQNIDDFISYLDSVLGNIDSENSQVVLAGGFNVDRSAKRNHLRHKNLYTYIHLYLLMQVGKGSQRLMSAFPSKMQEIK